MSLEESLAKLREASAKKAPPEKRAVLAGAVQQLRDSGMLEKTVKVGDKLPPFNLQNADGTSVSSADLLAKGPLVMTVFRGPW